jgi:glycosyltransferase involved in cell wall biosynthesis
MSPGYKPSVSVVVPAYNAAATIDDCVRSLLELRYPPEKVELRVVDNGSNDGTVDALRRYGDRIVLMHESKRGPAAARNAGVAGASGEVVAFTDADCIVDPEWLDQLVVPLQNSRVAVAGGTIRARRSGNEIERFGEEIHDHRQAIEDLRPPYAISMNWASRRELLRELGGFDERFLRAQDVDLSYRAIEASYELVFVGGAVIYHRNEDTLAGLFREGFVHGFHGVYARKRHQAFLLRYGHGRGGRPHYAEIGSHMLDWIRGRDPTRSKCDAVFNSGKKAGKLLGSIRFRRLDL